MDTASSVSAILSQLDYRSTTDEKISRAVLDAIYKGFEELGENVAKLVIHNLCTIHNLTEEQLVQRYELIEKAIKSTFGYSAHHILDHIRENLIMRYPSLKKKQLHYEEVVGEIRKADVLDFIHSREGHEHIAFLYSSNRTKSAILSGFFESAASNSNGLISVRPMITNKAANIVYEKFLVRGQAKPEAIDRMFQWIEKLHKSNTSERETRIAGEDASWFLRNDLGNEFLDAEKKIGRRVEDKISVLCAYDMGGIADKGKLKRIIESHGYVIVDQPLAVYKAP